MYAEFKAIGRLTKDPEEGLRMVKVGGEDVAVCNFSIACDADSRDGESDFYDCIAWRKNAENLSRYMSKGKLVFVSGRPHTRSWEKDGVRQYKTEYTIHTIKFLERGDKATTGAAATTNEPPF
jgi:single-strand DNA-binding protein